MEPGGLEKAGWNRTAAACLGRYRAALDGATRLFHRDSHHGISPASNHTARNSPGTSRSSAFPESAQALSTRGVKVNRLGDTGEGPEPLVPEYLNFLVSPARNITWSDSRVRRCCARVSSSPKTVRQPPSLLSCMACTARRLCFMQATNPTYCREAWDDVKRPELTNGREGQPIGDVMAKDQLATTSVVAWSLWKRRDDGRE